MWFLNIFLIMYLTVQLYGLTNAHENNRNLNPNDGTLIEPIHQTNTIESTNTDDLDLKNSSELSTTTSENILVVEKTEQTNTNDAAVEIASTTGDLPTNLDVPPPSPQPTKKKPIKNRVPLKPTDFQDTFIFDLMQEENGLPLVSVFLNAFKGTMENNNSNRMYIHISRQIKNLLKDSKGSKSISLVFSTFTKFLTDEAAREKLTIQMQNYQQIFTNPQAVVVIETINEFMNSLSNQSKSKKIINTLGTEVLSLLDLPDPKSVFIEGIQNLYSYTWPPSSES